MSGYLLAHDLGTSGDKATLFDTDGHLLASVTEFYDTNYFDGVCAEQNPLDWWKAFCSANRRLLQQVDSSKLLAVSFSGQMQGLLCVDKNGTPLRDFIIWADVRASKQTDRLAQKVTPRELYLTTGHPMNSSYTLEKLMWVMDHEPEVYRNTYKILSAKDYLIFRLTGRYVMDYSNGSATNAMDINQFCWSASLADGAGVDLEKFPTLCEATDVAGEVPASLAEETGLPAGTKIVVGGGDGQCASVGAGAYMEGTTYISAGSSSWISTSSHTAVFDDDMTITNFAHIVPGYVCPSGTMQTAGSAFKWLKDTICLDEISRAEATGKSPYDFINAQIAASPAGANGLLFLPYLMGERAPRWNPNAKGTLVGLSLSTTRGDIFRSVIEGIGLNLNVILETLQHDIDITKMSIIGGMARSNEVCQTYADIMKMDIVRLGNMDEVGSMGAAVAAGVGVGAFPDFSAIERFSSVESVSHPIAENMAVYDRMKPLFNQAYFDYVSLFANMSQMQEGK